MSRYFSRREFLKGAGAVAGGAFLAACKDTALATLGFKTPTVIPTGVPTPPPEPMPALISIATATPAPLLPVPTEFTNISYARINGGITGTVPNNSTQINTLIATNELSSRPGSIVGYKIDNDYIADLVGATKDEETKGNPHLTYSGGVYKGEGQYKNHRVEYSQGFWRAYNPTTSKEVAVINPNSFTYSLSPDAASGKPQVGFPVIEGNNILIIDGNGNEIERHPLFEESAAVAKIYGYTGHPAMVSRVSLAPDGLLRVFATEKKVDPVTRLEKSVDVPLKTLEAFNPLLGQQVAAIPQLTEWLTSLVTDVYDGKPVAVESYTGKYGKVTTTLEALRKELVNYPDQYVEKRVVGGQDVDALVVNGIPLAIKDSPAGEWKRSLEMEKATLDTLKPFVNAMKSAGVVTSTADILRQGLQVKNMTGKDGKTYPIAFTHLDPDPKKPDSSLAGDYPLFIGSEKGWEKSNLRRLAQIAGLTWGNSTTISYLQSWSSEYRNVTPIMAEHGNNYVIAFDLMWWNQSFPENSLRPDKDTFNYKQLDLIMKFAKEHNLSLGGQMLLEVLPKTLPPWLTKLQDKTEILRYGLTHISTLVSKYPQVSKWCIAGELENQYTQNFWAQKLGLEDLDWLKQSFEAANKANPNAKLYYSDFDIEYGGKKADRVFEIIKGLKESGTPIHEIAFQMHVEGRDFVDPQARLKKIQALKTQIARYKEIGIEVIVPEMDLNMAGITSDQSKRYNLQAQIEYDIVLALLESGVTDINHFGGTDKLNWKQDLSLAGSSSDANPTPFTDTGALKPNYFAAERAIIAFLSK